MATNLLDASTNDQTESPARDGTTPPPGAGEEIAELAEPEMIELSATESGAEAVEDGEPGTVDSAPEATAADAALNARPEQSQDAGSAPAPRDAVPTAASSDETATPWEDADTVEYNVVLHRGVSLDAIPPSSPPMATDMPALDELTRTHGDALPWPLPHSIIVGGRYRVEEAITTGPDSPGVENVYRVHDLQGYERCWSCGAEHGADAAPDRFCQQCGADMLSRDYLMYERHLEDESPAAPSDGSAEEQTARTFTQGARAYRVVAHVAAAPLFPRGVRVVAAMATDTGASRTGEENEDSAGIFMLSVAHDSRIEPLTLCVVADGLGGHASGQEASRLAVRILGEHILRAVALPYVSAPAGSTDDAQRFQAGLIGALKDGVEAANKAICARNKVIGADMGSTCVAVLVHRDIAYFVNAGDSRGYVLEDAGLRRVTTDHSLVEQLIASGLISPEERYTHPQRNQIFRSLGDEPNIALDTFTQQLHPGMRLLLCSDGLWEMVRDNEMADILRESSGPQQACDLLVSAANDHGGEDNICAVVVDICA